MFVFDKEQYIYKIGDMKIGGQPGENPTALAGTIFYSGDKIVSNPNDGEFDKKRAKALIQKQDEMSEITGNPSIVHIFAESAKAMGRYLDFTVEVSDSPIIIDSNDADVRAKALLYAEEIGILDRVIYNSLNISFTESELNVIEETGHDLALVLAFNPQDPSVSGRREVLENGILEMEEGLFRTCERIGIRRPIIDTAVTAMGAGAGVGVGFTFVAKSLYGYPAGSGIHNAPSSWPWLKGIRKENKSAYKAADYASNALAIMMSADYLLYGPIKSSTEVFPVAAMSDTLVAEYTVSETGIEPPNDHPYRKLL